jgi:hypothetical protein
MDVYEAVALRSRERRIMAAPEAEFPIFMNIFATPKRKTLQVKM